MTVSTTDSTAVFDGNGVATEFPFSFPFNANGDIKVYSKSAAGLITPVVSGFTVAGAGSASGGSVTMTVAPASGTKLVVSRELSLSQLIDLRNQGKFFAEVHELAFDTLAMQIQQLAEQVARSVKTDITATQSPDALIADINGFAVAAQASAVASAASASTSSSYAVASALSAAAAADSAALAGSNSVISESFGTQAVAIASSVLDLSAVTKGTVTVALNQNITSIIMPPGISGKRRDLTIQFAQDGASRTVSGWPAYPAVRFPSGKKPVISSVPGAITQVRLSNVDATFWAGNDAAVSGPNTMPVRVPSGQRLGVGVANGTPLTTIAMTAARCIYLPLMVARRTRIDTLGISVTAPIAGSATLGLYASDGDANNDYPGTLLLSSSAINTGSTGTKLEPMDYTLEPGVLYFVGLACSAAITLRGVAVDGKYPTLGFFDGLTTMVSQYYQATSGSVLPSPAGAVTPLSVVTPLITLIEA
jgi:hypothetical protein